MFCVLSVKERNRTLFERFFGRFLVDDYSVSTIPVFKGAPFFMLDITTSKKEIDWENVVFSVGKCASRLILTGDLKIPDDLNVGIFKSKILYEKMMKNTYVKILENNKSKLFKISVMDTNANNRDFVKQLSSYADSLYIFTLNKEAYSGTCEAITNETGMCPVLTNSFDNAEIKINADTLIMTICYGENMNISSGADFSVQHVYENLLPNGVDKYDFYSALYELCGVFSLGENIFDTIIVNNEKKNVHDIHFS